MTTITTISICAFCLSNDRNLSVIDKKYWKIVDSCFTSLDGKLEYRSYLQREHALQVCWECSAKLRNWHQFISTSLQSVRVLNAYLEAPTQIYLATVSKLCKTHIEILNTGPKYEETEIEYVADTLDTKPKYEEIGRADAAYTLHMGHIYEETDTANVDGTYNAKLENDTLNYKVVEDRPTPNDAANESIIKLEATTPSVSEYKYHVNFVEPAVDDDNVIFYNNDINEDVINFVEPAVDDDNVVFYNNDITEDVINFVEPAADDDNDVFYNNDVNYEVIEEGIVEKLAPEAGPSNAKNITKPKKKGRSEPKCTVQWVSKEQAQAWYTSEREQERVASPTHTHLCDKCQRGFAGEQELQAHVELCHSEAAGNYMCHMCQYRFVDQGRLRRHVESHFLFYKCKKCSYETRTLQSMQAHSRTEHVDEEAQRRRQQKNKEQQEKKSKENQKACSCKRCKNEFPSLSALREHRKGCKTYKCSECGAVYKSLKGHDYHVMVRHRPETKKTATGVMYCETCDMQFKDPANYKKHIQFSLRHVSRDDYKYQCGHCDLKFPGKHSMTLHITSVHLKKGRYQCEICPKSYNARTVYQRHRARQHNLGEDEELNKTCERCGKTFYSTIILENHIRTHTGEKPYTCEFCHTAFAQPGSLYKHCLGTHKKKIIMNKLKVSKGETFEDAGPDKYSCEECSKSFMFKNLLTDHINYVHKGRTDYVCKYCDKMFSSPSGLILHNRNTHGLKNKRNTEKNASAQSKPQSRDRILKCRACDATTRHAGALYTHYKLKHLKLKKSDRVRIRNLTRLDREIVVEQIHGGANLKEAH